MLVYPGTTVREFCHQLSPDMEKYMLYAEGADGRRVSPLRYKYYHWSHYSCVVG